MELVSEQPAAPSVDVDDLRERARRAVATEERTRLVVYSAALVYALVFAAAAAVQYFAFRDARLDLGNMVQAIWSTAHGHFLQVTTLSGREVSRLGAHVDPFLALFAPLWRVWPSPLPLLALEAAAVASGALPVYWLARKHLQSERAAAHFAFAYLLFPSTQFNAFALFTGFHSVSFAVPLILFAIWFLDNNRLLPFAVVALLAASTKEEIPLAVGCLGIWYAIRRGRRLVGLSIFAIGLGLTLVDVLLVIPHYAPSGVSPFAGRYVNVGGTPGGMLHTLHADPLAFVHDVATWHKAAFVLLLFLPFLGLWALEPLLLLGAAPDLVIDLLSSKPEQSTINFHYTAGIIPFLVAASILGAARLKRNPDSVSFFALAGAALLVAYSPIWGAIHDVRQALPSSPVHAAKAHALDLIPPSAAVSASNELGGYLSQRTMLSTYPALQRADWVIVDLNDPTYANAARYRRDVAVLDASPRWTLVYSSHGVQVLRKRSG